MLTTAVIGAVFGALGALLGYLVARAVTPASDETPPRWPIVVGIVAAVALSRPAMQLIDPPSVDDQMAEAEATLPVLRAIRTHDPQTYRQIRAIVSEADRGSSFEAATQRMRAIVGRSFQTRLASASDDQVSQASRYIADEYRSLQQAPDVCVAHVMRGNVDIKPYLSREILQREQQMMTRAFEEAPLADPVLASDEQRRIVITNIATRIASEERIPVDRVAAALDGSGEPALLCRVFTRLFEGLAALPPPQSGPVLRRIFSDAAGTPRY